MATTAIRHIGEKAGQPATVEGWLFQKRSSGKIQFLIVRDGSGYLQAVVPRADVPPETWEAAERATQEASIRVTGTVREDKRAPGGFEMTASAVEVLGPSENYPITPKEHGVDFLMNLRHLWMRSSQQHAVLRVRSELEQAIADFFYEREYVRIDSPILTGSSVEGTSTLFETDYFGDKAYLSQSGQLYLEPAAAAFGKVYCFGPTFRAEKSKTRRHLTEFWMVEPEVAFMDFEGLCRLAEDFIAHLVGRALDRCREDLKRLERDTAKLEAVEAPVPAHHVPRGDRAASRRRAFRSSSATTSAPTRRRRSREGLDRPLIVSRFPTAIKSFYMQPDPQDPEVVLGLDMLAPEGYGEIIGGSQRIHDLALLEQRLEEHKLPREAYEWYLDVRRYGTFPHAGLRHGPRARRDVDLRDPPPARGDPVSADAEADLPVSTPNRCLRSESSRSAARRTSWTREIMLGHLARAGHAIVPDGEARVVVVNTCGFIDKAKEESVEAILEQVERKNGAARSTASSSRAAWSRSTAASSRPRSRRSTRFLGLDELEKAPAAAAGLPSLPRFTDKPLATRLYDEAAPRVLSRRRGYAYLKVGEGCDNPAPSARSRRCGASSAAARSRRSSRRRRRLEAQGVSELVLISQDTTRYGEDLGMKRAGAGAPRRGASRRDGRFPGSASSTPTRRPSTTRCSSSWRASRGSCPTWTFRSSTSPARCSPRCAAGGDPASYRAMIARMRDTRAGDRDPDDLHRRASRARARRSSASSASSSATPSSTTSARSPTRRSRARARSRSATRCRPRRRSAGRSSSCRSSGRSRAGRSARPARPRRRGDRRGPVRGDGAPARGPAALAGARDRRAAPDQRHGRTGRRGRATSSASRSPRRTTTTWSDGSS